MLTKVLKADFKKNIQLAAELIRKGRLVAFPTETVYGLGADATNETAVAKLFAVKRRPVFDPLIVHVASMDMLLLVVNEVTELACRLINTFWPGPLTLVLAKADRIPGVVTAHLPTVAVRMPRNEVALALINEAGVPIAAPSANSFGRPSPTCADHVVDDLGGKIALILDGGPTQVGLESTVLDLTCSPPVILRPGGVSKECLENILGKLSVSLGSEGEMLKSPGQMKQHYAPRAKVLLFGGNCRERVIVAMRGKIKELKAVGKIGVMVPEEELSHFTHDNNVVVMNMGSFAAMEMVANSLFAVMRALDVRGVNYILALAPSQEGIGLAVFDRLYKAAGSQLIEVV